MQTQKLTVEITSFLFILLWVYAGVSKLIDYEQFKVQLGKSPLVTEFATSVAVGLPITELVIATLLVPIRTRIFGLYCSLFLMMAFTVYLIAILNFSYYIPCSCGGILSGLGWKEHVVFNLFFVALAIVAILFIRPEGKPQTIERKIIFP
jgi:hypothetical protein